MIISPEDIGTLSSEKRRTIMERSMEDISSIYDYVRNIVKDVKDHGDPVLLKVNSEFKEDVTAVDLVVTDEEIREAYDRVDGAVVSSLKAAAENIIKFHTAQKERDMWSIEICEGVLAGRITRPMDRVGCYVPGGRRQASPKLSPRPLRGKA